MGEREWKPGDVATTGPGSLVLFYENDNTTELMLVNAHGYRHPARFVSPAVRPLVVIDPEDREQVERLVCALENLTGHAYGLIALHMQAALREFANPKPEEPTDPKARVEDRRENMWRLLADGDWVCTSGPDIGEYLTWGRLAAERGPLSIEVTP